jgi:hypothetical protein
MSLVTSITMYRDFPCDICRTDISKYFGTFTSYLVHHFMFRIPKNATIYLSSGFPFDFYLKYCRYINELVLLLREYTIALFNA